MRLRRWPCVVSLGALAAALPGQALAAATRRTVDVATAGWVRVELLGAGAARVRDPEGREVPVWIVAARAAGAELPLRVERVERVLAHPGGTDRNLLRESRSRTRGAAALFAVGEAR